MKPYFAIRHKPTGFYLPKPKGRQGRGGSFVEPTDPKEDHPRTFPTERGARSYLVQWLRGHHESAQEFEPTDEYGSGFYYTAGADVKHQPHRIKEDMEIIEMILVPMEKHYENP